MHSWRYLSENGSGKGWLKLWIVVLMIKVLSREIEMRWSLLLSLSFFHCVSFCCVYFDAWQKEMKRSTETTTTKQSIWSAYVHMCYCRNVWAWHEGRSGGMWWHRVRRDVNLHCNTLCYYYVHKKTEHPAAAHTHTHTHGLFYSTPQSLLCHEE